MKDSIILFYEPDNRGAIQIVQINGEAQKFMFRTIDLDGDVTRIVLSDDELKEFYSKLTAYMASHHLIPLGG